MRDSFLDIKNNKTPERNMLTDSHVVKILRVKFTFLIKKNFRYQGGEMINIMTKNNIDFILNKYIFTCF